MPLQPGQKAPDFSLYDTEKQKVSLADYSGKNLLILFFPLAFSSTCTAELCSVRDNIGAYSGVKAEVIAISVDSLHTLAKFKADQHLNFKLLSDFNKDVSASYECLYETFSYDMKGVSKRAAYVIDKTGIVRYSEVKDKASELPDFSAIVAVLNDIA